MFELWRRGGFDLRGTIVGCVIAIAVGFSGIAVINAFAVEFFLNTGFSVIESSLANVALSIVSLISNLISAFLIDGFGRRRVLLVTIGAILMLNISISSLMFLYEKAALPWIGDILIGATALFLVSMAFGPGPLCYFISSEMVYQNARSAAQSWANLIMMISRALILTIYLPLRNAIGNGEAFLSLFVAPVLLSLIYLYFHLPETKNRSLQEIHREVKVLPKFPRFNQNEENFETKKCMDGLSL